MKSLGHLLKNISSTFLKYPVPMISAIIGFVCIILEIHVTKAGSSWSKSHLMPRIALEAIGGISFFIGVDFFKKSKGLNFSKQVGLYALGFCILGMHFYSIAPGMFDTDGVFIIRYLLFIVAYHLFVSIVAFSIPDEVSYFWHYNYALFANFLLALAFSLAMYLGLAGALLSIDKLFDLHISHNYYTDLALFIFIVMNTLIFLMQIPKDFSEYKQPKEIPTSLRIFVQYILIPIVIVYALILYFYVVKMILEAKLPDGWVCTPILFYAATGMLAYLLSYPIRNNTAYKNIHLYAKYFFFTLIPLLCVYFIAIIKRIKPYGLTEERYLVFILGIWLLIISIYIILSQVDNIIIIPSSLLVLIAISSIGPWGMFQLSLQNQLGRLERNLKRNNLLQNGKVISDAKTKVPKEDIESIRSILSYINKRDKTRELRHWLNDEQQIRMDSAIAKNETAALYSVFLSNILNEDNLATELHVAINPIERLFESYPLELENESKVYFFSSLFESHLSASIENNNLTLKENGDILLLLDLNPKLQMLHKERMKTDSISREEAALLNSITVIDAANIEWAAPNDSLWLRTSEISLFLNRIQYVQKQKTITISDVEGYVILPNR